MKTLVAKVKEANWTTGKILLTFILALFTLFFVAEIVMGLIIALVAIFAALISSWPAGLLALALLGYLDSF